MQFIDEAIIEVAAGAGGPGAVSFRREYREPLGGPDGGDGGDGGDVIVEADSRTTTLMDHRYRRFYRAEAGKRGGGARAAGRAGESIVITLPVGTVVTDEQTGEVIADLTEEGQQVVLASGGRGGRGNWHFRSSTRRAPRHAQDGEPGEERMVHLSLKLMADVGLVGLPNAGKSTFIRAVSNSQAKVASYPFTTLVPNLGVVRVDEEELVLADIPGLVEGAHEGQGLGDRFLKHIERTRALLHLISLGPDAPDPLEAHGIVTAELEAHLAELLDRPQVVVLNKVDLVEDRYELDLWREAFAERGVKVFYASGLTGENTRDVLRHLRDLLRPASAEEGAEHAAWWPI